MFGGNNDADKKKLKQSLLKKKYILFEFPAEMFSQ